MNIITKFNLVITINFMYYRRKIFLALLEAFDGSLDNTDFEKLLFLYCQFSNKNHYDFFPYKFGCFSHLSYHDKRVLTSQGLLKNADNFSLSKKENYSYKIKNEDLLSLQKFTSLYKGIKGNELIKKTYIEFPYFAVKSEIVPKILNEHEIDKIRKVKNISSEKTLFTLGYEGLSIDAYINKLIQNNIVLVIDVRKNPLSMKYGFSKTKMKSYLEKAGVEYIHIPKLGINSELRKNLNTERDYKDLFKIYKNEILTQNKDSINTVIDLLNKFKRVALTCFESEYTSCHRHKITECLENDYIFNERVIHL
jgi:hypothetical protein